MDTRFPLFASSNTDREYLQAYCIKELQHWRKVMQQFHSITRGSKNFTQHRLQMRGPLEIAWNNLRASFQQVLIRVN